MSPRDRLLAAADELFYAEGINTVGIDRIIERAGVAKASLYRLFGTKDGLVSAWLQHRHDRIAAEFATALDHLTDPRAGILKVFEVQATWTRRKSYFGCAFTRSVSEPVGDSVAQAVEAYRDYLMSMFTGLAEELNVSDPHQLAHQLYALYHAAAPAHEPRRRQIMMAVRHSVQTLIDTAPRVAPGSPSHEATPRNGHV